MWLFSNVNNRLIIRSINKSHFAALLRTCQTSSNVSAKSESTSESSNKIKEKNDPDMFISEIPNPYESTKKVCILCKYKVPVDYKNPKLLNQFISPYTGFIYERHITGLCKKQHTRVVHTIKKSQFFGYMTYLGKNVQYLKDPKLYDPFNPSRPNPH
ncbi:28S ribosomal protein S18c, mitochondrial-like [Uloborus diversus]|uniref:28S ribosomal protein S18c, mitochondrial-like n=1 Tax=Uloborus diversus TaxID=327109 RepID=UPI00240A38C2|nr:28S ribosomal protein S18c, mitochondrial-like [Uloborus diversus]